MLGRSFAKRVYVGSLHYALTADDVRTAFAPFGVIESLEVPDDAVSGHHKGFAFIEFGDESAAALAMATMDGFPLAGRRIKVSRPQSLGVSLVTGGAGGAGAPPPPPSKAGSVAAAAAAAAAAAVAAGRMPAAPAVAAWPHQQQPWEHGTPPQSPVTPAQQRPSTTIFLADWHPALSEEDVRSVSSAFGNLAAVQVRADAPCCTAHLGLSARRRACVRRPCAAVRKRSDNACALLRHYCSSCAPAEDARCASRARAVSLAAAAGGCGAGACRHVRGGGV